MNDIQNIFSSIPANIPQELFQDILITEGRYFIGEFNARNFHWAW